MTETVFESGDVLVQGAAITAEWPLTKTSINSFSVMQCIFLPDGQLGYTQDVTVRSQQKG